MLGPTSFQPKLPDNASPIVVPFIQASTAAAPYSRAADTHLVPLGSDPLIGLGLP